MKFLVPLLTISICLYGFHCLHSALHESLWGSSSMGHCTNEKDLSETQQTVPIENLVGRDELKTNSEELLATDQVFGGKEESETQDGTTQDENSDEILIMSDGEDQSVDESVTSGGEVDDISAQPLPNATSPLPPPNIILETVADNTTRTKLKFPMADSTVLWLASLGFITAMMGCCLLYSLRQVTVLRESVHNLVADLTSVRNQQQQANDTLETALIKRQEEEDEAAGKVDTQELLLRLRSLENEVEDQETRIVEVSRRSAEIAASPIQKTTEATLPSLSEELSRDAGKSNDVKQIYEEILGAIKQQGPSFDVGSPSKEYNAHQNNAMSGSTSRGIGPAATYTTSTGGLSYSLPPSFVVYICRSGAFQGKNYSKRFHSVRVGVEHSDVALVFSVNAEGEADVVIPIDEVVSMTMAKDVIVFDDSECVTVTVMKRSKLARDHGHSAMTLRHRSSYDPLQSDTETCFIFSVPPCPGFDEWCSFMNEHFPQKLIVKDIL